MISASLEITYRRGKPYAAYFHLPHERADFAAKTEKISDDLVVDYAEDGRPIGVEIVSPGYVTRTELSALLKRLELDPDLIDEFVPVLAKAHRKRPARSAH